MVNKHVCQLLEIQRKDCLLKYTFLSVTLVVYTLERLLDAYICIIYTNKKINVKENDWNSFTAQ